MLISLPSCKEAQGDVERINSKTFTWTVPNSGCGILVAYDLRYSPDSTIDIDMWMQVDNEPYPGAVSSMDSCMVDSLPNGISYGMIRSQNSYGLWSEWGNMAIKDICSTPPDTIGDLR